MADPITWAIALGAVGATTGAFGVYKQGVSESAEAKGQAAVADYNARVAQQEQLAIEQKSAFDQRRQAQEAERIASRMRAALGTSGVISSEGTPLALQAEQAGESELDNLLMGYEAEINASRALSQQNILGMQSKIYQHQAGSAMSTGYIRSGSTLLTGLGSSIAMGSMSRGKAGEPYVPGQGYERYR